MRKAAWQYLLWSPGACFLAIPFHLTCSDRARAAVPHHVSLNDGIVCRCTSSSTAHTGTYTSWRSRRRKASSLCRASRPPCCRFRLRRINSADYTLRQVVLSFYACLPVEFRRDKVAASQREARAATLLDGCNRACCLLHQKCPLSSCEVICASQIPETLPDEVVAKMHGPPKPDVPPVTTAHLEEADGLLLGFPTR